MMQAMTGKEGYYQIFARGVGGKRMRANRDWRGWQAPWCGECGMRKRKVSDWCKGWKVREAGAAYYGYMNWT